MIRHKRYIVITIVIIGLAIFCSSIVYSSTKRFEIKSVVEYTVQDGETITDIAERFKPAGEETNIFLLKMQLLNSKNDGIYPKDKLLIPVEE